jgi:hypothetical protein
MINTSGRLRQQRGEVVVRLLAQASACALVMRIVLIVGKKRFCMRIENGDKCLFTGTSGRLRQYWDCRHFCYYLELSLYF